MMATATRKTNTKKFGGEKEKRERQDDRGNMGKNYRVQDRSRVDF